MHSFKLFFQIKFHIRPKYWKGPRMGNKNAKAVITDEDLDFISKHTAANRDDIKQQFDNFLVKHPDGKIDKGEFKEMMKTCYPDAKAENLENHIFPMYDFNGDGHIDFQEFMIVLYIMSSGTREENLGQIFRVFDTNRDGTISQDEMKRIVKNLFYLFKLDENVSSGQGGKQSKTKSMMKQESKDFAMKAFKEMDQNKDGKVTKEEFIAACLAQNLDTGNVSAKLALGIVDVFIQP